MLPGQVVWTDRFCANEMLRLIPGEGPVMARFVRGIVSICARMGADAFSDGLPYGPEKEDEVEVWQ